MPLETLDAVITSIHSLTPRANQFLLQVDGHTFSYKPGQHLSIAIEDESGAPVYRPYSPVNRPGTNTVALAVKRYEDGTASVWMHERSLGDHVPLTSPSGNLHLYDLERDVVFLSTGTGITPMLSMLMQYLDEGKGHATFLFGERTQKDLMYRETLDRLSASHANLTVEYVLSDEHWSGPTGFVQDHLWEVVDKDTSAHFYLCGVPEMVVDTKDRLAEAGVPDERVFTEGWEQGAVDE